MPDNKKKAVYWHTAFYAAMYLELLEDKLHLEYFPEFLLGKQPLKTDLLLINKKGEIAFKSPIAKHFNKYNIIEYKSPVKTLDINGFFRAQAYAALYRV